MLKRIADILGELENKDIINYTYSFKVLGIGVKPAQVKEKKAMLLAVLDRLKPKTLLVDTANGGPYFCSPE